ncbi:murein biosynthesis integral membrane protein MurJ [Mesobacillus subterraneus]|uniref:murein biosynthesis integral membrane protein MurJ n=1 Tax=Mesobacillus subterraneus TaxID=285983 RepID=UPI001CFD7C8B|nr:lipid II flippase MurJ [Mesobacillus subterraneus]
MSNLKKAGIIALILSLFLKFSGFLREGIIAKQFGASAETDGYIIAFSVITLFVLMTSEGFNSVFLPLFIKNKQEDEEGSLRNANALLNIVLVIILAFSSIIYFMVPYLIPLVFNVFQEMHPETEVIAIRLSQFFVLFLFMITVNGMLESYLQAYRSFIPAQVSRIFGTLTGAFFALAFSNIWGIDSLAYGFVAGIFLGIVVQVIYLKKYGFKWMPVFSLEKEFRITFLSLFLPAILSAVLGQINVTVDRIFASNTIEGAVTYLNNASLIVSIPNAILGTTIIAIVFTLLSENVKEKVKFQETVLLGLQMSAVLLLPLTAGLAILGKSVIGFIFERGAFTPADTINTYLALLFYLPLIVTQGLQIIVLKALYAKGKTKLIFKLSFVTITANMISNYFLAKWLGYLGPALSSSIIAVIFLLLTSKIMYKDFNEGEAQKFFRSAVKLLLPTAIMAVVVAVTNYFSVRYINSYIVLIILNGITGIIVYFAALKFLSPAAFAKLMTLLPLKRFKK